MNAMPGGTKNRTGFWSKSNLTFAVISFIALGTLGLLTYSAIAHTGGVFALKKLVCHSCSESFFGAVSPLHFGVWLGLIATTGITLFAFGRSLISQIRATSGLVSRELRDIKPLPLEIEQLVQNLGLTGRVNVVVSDAIFSFTLGLVKPRIFVSDKLLQLLEPREIEALLLHEKSHLVQYDPLKVVLVRCISKAFFYIPLLKYLESAYCAYRELEADSFAVHRMSGGIELSSALVKLLRGTGGPRGLAVSNAMVAEGAGGGDSVTDLRIRCLLRGGVSNRGLARLGVRPRARAILISAFSLSLVIAGWLPGYHSEVMAASAGQTRTYSYYSAEEGSGYNAYSVSDICFLCGGSGRYYHPQCPKRHWDCRGGGA